MDVLFQQFIITDIKRHTLEWCGECLSLDSVRWRASISKQGTNEWANDK